MGVGVEVIGIGVMGGANRCGGRGGGDRCGVMGGASRCGGRGGGDMYRG